MPEQLLHGMEESGRILGVGRSMVYALVERGELDTVKVGRRTLVVATSLAAFVERQVAAKAADKASA